ncbi:hypothetical protein M2103_002596 [Ereboglobus sp. PH5-5]|uniref:alginate lyase family protein n=1 Tax=Ereboglobus sp. PH5-5 TaxID=2940529 RepID=UPI002406744A|nr:alginate lyase family protein [Ereboglobus sp. PH5-5]MDF9834350.1 hypothetical protein [Ereboglobus sp. PH5-5]
MPEKPAFIPLLFLSACLLICAGCDDGARNYPEESARAAGSEPAVSITTHMLPGFDLARHEYARTLRLADAALDADPVTIVSARNPRSAGDAHDFSSEGDYWWPDPKNPAAPYARRDGMTNPDNFVAHRRLMMEFSRNVSALAAAYKLTREERYGAAAVEHLRAWFVTPETRMNPSLEYAQSIKGRHTGRGIGVIDTLHLAEVAMAVVALRGADAEQLDNAVAFTPETDAAVTAWFRDYLRWMRTHKYGIDESNAKNNHSTCWTLQAACFARVTGDTAVLDECRARLVTLHIPNQMADDGSFPLELERTKPYGYSIFNLDVMCALAQVVGTPTITTDIEKHPDGSSSGTVAIGNDYMTWRVSEADDRGMIKAVAYLAPFLADKSKWPLKPDVMHWNDWPVRQPALLFGAMSAGNETWLATWKRLDPDRMVEEVQRNFPIRHPVLWY